LGDIILENLLIRTLSEAEVWFLVYWLLKHQELTEAILRMVIDILNVPSTSLGRQSSQAEHVEALLQLVMGIQIIIF
jgi:hypothetical protein